MARSLAALFRQAISETPITRRTDLAPQTAQHSPGEHRYFGPISCAELEAAQGRARRAGKAEGLITFPLRGRSRPSASRVDMRPLPVTLIFRG
jgi:hypothetical protein